MPRQNKLWIGIGIVIGLISGYDLVERFIEKHQVSWFKTVILAGCVLLVVSLWRGKNEREIKNNKSG